MRISDWSSDVCSSDLIVVEPDELPGSEIGKVGVGEAEGDGPQQWPAGDGREGQQQRRQKQPGGAAPTSGKGGTRRDSRPTSGRHGSTVPGSARAPRDSRDRQSVV